MQNFQVTDSPLVTVIIPVYNTRRFISESLSSITSQSMREIEVLCIDDASTDGSLELLREIADQDERVKVFSLDRNSGPGAVRNFGLNRATGRYVYFFDSDDLLEIEALQKLVDQAEAENLDAVFFNAEPFIDQSAVDALSVERYQRQYRRSHSYASGLPGVAMFVEMSAHGEWMPSPCLYILCRSFLEHHRLRFTEGVLHEDNGFTARMMLAAPRTGYDESPFFKRRIRKGSVTTGELTSHHLVGLVTAIAELVSASRTTDRQVPETAAAIHRQADALFQDAVQKVRRLAAHQQQIFREWCLVDSFGSADVTIGNR